MFVEMRRAAQALSDEECVQLLQKQGTGVLGLNGNDSYPYTVPVNYVYAGGKILIHCGKQGYKLDCIRNNAKASFTVIGMDELHPEEWTTWYQSVILFGTCRIVEEPEEIYEMIKVLCDSLGTPDPDTIPCVPPVKDGKGKMVMIELTPEHMTGKQSSHLYDEKSLNTSDAIQK